MRVNSIEKEIVSKEYSYALKGLEISYIDDLSRTIFSFLGTHTVTLLPRKPLKIVDATEFLFKIHITSPTREHELVPALC